jgi:hypothetical protein
LAGPVLLLALVMAGCGDRRVTAAGTAPASPSTGTPAIAPTFASNPASTAAPTPSATAAFQEDGATPVLAQSAPPTPSAAPRPSTGPAPLATPNLTAIQQLLDGLDATLAADAIADIDEGSTK